MAVWKGGKARIASRLLQLFPPHRCYVEPFGGMASVLLNKPRVETEIYNDRDVRLVSLFAVIKYHPEAFDRELRELLKSRRQYDWYKEQPGITEIQRAARFLYCQQLGYGGQGRNFGTEVQNGGATTRSIDALRAMAARIRERLQSVIIEWLDWEVCLEKYDSRDTFFYCDPPYWGTDGYAVPFSERDQQALADRLRASKGKWLVTNSDAPAVRQLYRGFRTTVLKGQLCLPRDHSKVLRHLIVTNYDPPRR
jgi:DNA adenine methylase